jgi:hypothetical protein
VSLSYIKVYNEQVYDFLVPSGKVLSLREDQDKGAVVIAGVAAMVNQVSSRSHAILQLTIKSRSHIKLPTIQYTSRPHHNV